VFGDRTVPGNVAGSGDDGVFGSRTDSDDREDDGEVRQFIRESASRPAPSKNTKCSDPPKQTR